MVTSKPIRVKKKTTSIAELNQPKLTMKQRVMVFIRKQNKSIIVNDFYNTDKTMSRRVVEKAFTDLTNSGYIKRERCICGCSYVYTVDKVD